MQVCVRERERERERETERERQRERDRLCPTPVLPGHNNKRESMKGQLNSTWATSNTHRAGDRKKVSETVRKELREREKATEQTKDSNGERCTRERLKR